MSSPTCASCDHPRGWHLLDRTCLWLVTGPATNGCTCDAYVERSS